MPADVLRDREGVMPDQPVERPAGDDLTTPPPSAPGGGFATLADRISQNDFDLASARQARARAGEAEQTALARRQDRMAPEVAKTRDLLAQPMPAPPQPVETTPPPSRKLSDFLSHTEGESPENTISKLLQGVSLMATGFVGLRRGDARGTLASLKGAMEGWQQGDKQRADRAFLDWKSNMDRLLEENFQRHQAYRDVLADRKLTVDQQLKVLELLATEYGHEAVAAGARKGDADALVKELTQQQNHLDTMKSGADRLSQMHQDKVMHDQTLIELAKIRAQEKVRAENDFVGTWTPEALQIAGQQWILSGKMPSGVGVGRAGAIVKGMVTKAGVEWARTQGLDLKDLPGIRAEVGSADNAIKDNQKRMAVAKNAVGTFDRHMDRLVELGKKVDRSGSPVANRAYLHAKGQYEGDADVAAYNALALEAGQEFAKVSVGTAQGDSSSREEARKAINAALNQEQLTKVAAELKRAAHQRLKQYEETDRDLLERVRQYTRPKGEGKMLIRRLGKDGKYEYAEGPEGAVPPGWEKYEEKK